ncbi:hypothetical protein [Sandaracinus amylolyticus]|uniref:Secreted protein n=1 Tax=Sandaracinus amylolyticus TaxID=927083 RepID=A0A0F6SHI1_9BACT|nr:hypothetical protein [Sandaracinus amylolyticus]AKF10484.1 hypothetical protein DB32_007633 [Sandaracinus amylolyticus]
MLHRSFVLVVFLSLVALPAAAQERSSEVVRTLERSATRIQHLLGETRRAGDVRRASCVDEQLSQLTATLRLALERQHRANRHEDRGDRVMAERERALITRLSARGQELEREAQLCVDPDALEGNRTRVTVLIDPDVPDDALEEITDRRAVFAR